MVARELAVVVPALLQLVVLAAQFHYLAHLRHQRIETTLHPVVQVAHYKRHIRHYIWVYFLSLVPHVPDQLAEHVVAFVEVLGAVHQVRVHEVEQVVVQLERQLQSSLIAQDVPDARRFVDRLRVLEVGHMLQSRECC